VRCGAPPKNREARGTKSLDLRPCVDLRVAVGGGQIGVTKPATDDVDVHSSFKKMDGRGMTEEVRAHAPPGPHVRIPMIPYTCSDVSVHVGRIGGRRPRSGRRLGLAIP
jgi:hypothetical protein